MRARENSTSEGPTGKVARKKVAVTASRVVGISSGTRRPTWSPTIPIQGESTMTTTMAAASATDSAASGQPFWVSQVAK